ncbi:MAG: hypothetical protein PHZ00_05580 [Candidatus Peribacteraceae bacterium]|nr:hypothetical protein [Candidatus Peribacteraceae bacterium]
MVTDEAALNECALSDDATEEGRLEREKADENEECIKESAENCIDEEALPSDAQTLQQTSPVTPHAPAIVPPAPQPPAVGDTFSYCDGTDGSRVAHLPSLTHSFHASGSAVPALPVQHALNKHEPHSQMSVAPFACEAQSAKGVRGSSLHSSITQ